MFWGPAPSHAQVRGGADTAPSHAQVRGGADTAPSHAQVRGGAGTAQVRDESGNAPARAEPGAAPMRAESGVGAMRAESGDAPVREGTGTTPVRDEAHTAPVGDGAGPARGRARVAMPAGPAPVPPPPVGYPPTGPVGAVAYGYPPGHPPPPGYPPPYGYPLPPGYPPPGWPAAPAPPPHPPVRHSPLGWTVVVASLLVIVVSAAIGVTRFLRVPPAPEVTWYAAHEIAAPPPADAPAAEWNAWVRQAIAVAMREQATALLAGDEEGYLAPVDPDDTRLRDDLRRRFAVLSQMGVGHWSQEIRATPDVTGKYSWHAEIRISYCFGDQTCRPNDLLIGTDWRLRGDDLVLTGLTYSGADQVGPRPWEAAELAVATGPRTVVATSPRLDQRLPGALAAAEEAAAVADSLARWGGPPSRYVIFLADSGDWSTWYGLEQPEWTAGAYVNQTDNEVVINASVVSAADTRELLIHELAHVATLAGERDGLRGSTWWLVEGVADYAMMLDRPLYDYAGIPAVRSFLRQSWDGDPAVDHPSVNATSEEAAARYGIAFLTVWRMADVYGHEAMLDFFGRVVHDGASLEDAAQAAYGESWATIRDDCERFIRSV